MTLPRLLLCAALLGGCGRDGTDTNDTDDADGSDTDAAGDVDPMVGDWVGTRFSSDGDVYELPLAEGGSTTELEFSFTDEPRGLLTWLYTEDGVTSRDTFEFAIDVFEPGRWLLEIEDPSSDMEIDCAAEGDEMACGGTCDGLACTIDLVRAE
jgi:hypothetical protein